ncbi:hypothetical protein ACQPXM_06590 [Kribbella sp. CA-253562]|uniref:hypothetical protein n=1 Tax=Kribbella sp. CA-253562 TaxID=3239942 RepID=UPI003D94A9E1
MSPSDLPFLHPFGNDFEFHVAPDPAYFDLLAGTGDDLYTKSTKRARQEFGLNVPNVIGMEWDEGMVPAQYHPKLGDRVCLWGRWIIDAGHNDFHTEIHPPLLMVSARPTRSQFQPQGARTKDATACLLISRPYLVSQLFNNGPFDETGLYGHLVHEWADVQLGVSSLIKAHPKLTRMPFEGLNIMMFKLRPPTPRKDARDQLMVTFELTRRDDSCAIDLLRGTDGDSVRVLIVFNDASYKPPTSPPSRNRRYKVADIKRLDSTAGTIMEGAIFTSLGVAPHAGVILNRGIETHEFPRLAAPPLGPSTTAEVDDLRADVPPDNSHPFPIAGKITVEWRRFSIVAPGDTTTKRISG